MIFPVSTRIPVFLKEKKNNCWDLRRNDAKLRRVSQRWQKGANVVDLFIIEYFPDFWGLHFPVILGVKKPNFPFHPNCDGAYRILFPVFLNVPQSHACCKSCKKCCYFSFKLNWDWNQYFFQVNNHKPTGIYLFIFKAIILFPVFLNVPQSHAYCKSCKICCYFSFKLN